MPNSKEHEKTNSFLEEATQMSEVWAKRMKKMSEDLKEREFSKLEKLINFIEEKGEITPKEAEAVSGKSAATARRYLKMLVGTGYVEAEGNTNNSVYKISECMNEK